MNRWNVCLAVAIFVLMLAELGPHRTQAAPSAAAEIWFEPGIKQIDVPGVMAGPAKIAINLNTGEIWGFPVDANAGYPRNATGSRTAVSRPHLLGRFDLSAMR